MANEFLTVKQAQYLLEKWASEYVPNRNGILLNPTLNGSISIGGTPTFDSTATRNAWVSALGLKNTVSVKNGGPSVPNNTDTTVCNTGSLSPGTYLLNCHVYFTTNATGRRRAWLATSNGGGNIDRYSNVLLPPASGGGTDVAFTYIASPTSATTYYLRAYQNSGSAITVTAGIQVLLLHY